MISRERNFRYTNAQITAAIVVSHPIALGWRGGWTNRICPIPPEQQAPSFDSIRLGLPTATGGATKLRVCVYGYKTIMLLDILRVYLPLGINILTYETFSTYMSHQIYFSVVPPLPLHCLYLISLSFASNICYLPPTLHVYVTSRESSVSFVQCGCVVSMLWLTLDWLMKVEIVDREINKLRRIF